MNDSSRPEDGEPIDDWENDDSAPEDEESSNQNATENVHQVDKPVDADSDATSEDDGAEHDTDAILEDYRRLISRRVDLVGDYAGSEHFLIHGESMLLRCFSDKKLDFNPGLQLLHAGYNVERFLHHLVQRKCKFNIVFFTDNRRLCIPPSADPSVADKYLLARAVVIRHLRVHLAKAQPDIVIDEFSSYDSVEFAEYLRQTSPYFVMAHDGAESTLRRSKHVEDVEAETENAASSTLQRRALRAMILAFIGRGYNVALVNGLEWRDTKVMTMVLERRHRGDAVRVHTLPVVNGTSDDVSDCLDDLKALHVAAPELTERQRLAVISVSKLLRSPPSSVSKEALTGLCSSFLLHQAVLEHLPLSSRRLAIRPAIEDADDFIAAIASQAETILRNKDWSNALTDSSTVCDVIDFVDGRLFLQTSAGKATADSQVRDTHQKLSAAVKQLCGSDLPLPASGSSSDTTVLNGDTNGMPSGDLSVLPFSNPVFDKHLASIRLQIDETAATSQTSASDRIFREITHWHNVKKPLVQRGPPTAQTEREKMRADRRNQTFMADMQKYAASLTNAVGKSLEPETIIVGSGYSNTRQAKSSIDKSVDDSDSAESSSVVKKGKPEQKKGGGGKKGAQNAAKQAMMDKIKADMAKKDETSNQKVVNSWHTACKGLDADNDPRVKYRKAKDYLINLRPDWKNVIDAECELYMLNCLLQYWIELCRRKEKAQNMEVAALIWSHASSICRRIDLTKDIITSVELAVKTLGLPSVPTHSRDSMAPRKLAFTFALPSKVDSLSISMDSKDFQLQYGGPYMERSFDSKPDQRVDFQPDGWQREVLDGIDRNKSLFVVAPTSAGKTFISFYAMRKVLEADDDGILVYVAPTKALVNQIAAEIQARYSKSFKHGGKSVWAIHTRDYRINTPTTCQVLVTVPHVLQIMLLAPTNANSWSNRVKRIIYDEVHSIGQAEDGVVWEQLLLLSPCPILCLSATVGNPREFADWLQSTQKAIGVDLHTCTWPHRYSDLRKYYYVPPKQFSFHGLPEKTGFGRLALEQAPGFNRINPVAVLVDKTRGIPEDLALEPGDCLELWHAMNKYKTTVYPLPEELHPQKALPDVSRKADVLRWERELKTVLQKWLEDEASPYDKVLADLEKNFRDGQRLPLQSTHQNDADVVSEEPGPPEELNAWTLAMLCRLYEQGALPAILFNFDRGMCEQVCRSVLDQLESAELAQQKSGTKWEQKLERWEQWKKVQEKTASKKPKAPSKKAAAKSRDDADDEQISKLDRQRDAGGADGSQWESFDPDAPMEGYHFADYTKVQMSEMEIFVKQLKYRDISQWLINGLRRGIGIHHAGMNRKYRQIVEILFRKGFLRVVIATGTLALGINMPCKTVVFSGDSVFLTALNYRQCAGRAGRRGFDLLGNVVFQGISREKVCRLISSRLPDLNGHFPISTTLVLRLFTLLTESKNSKYAVSAVDALLSQPRLYMGGPSFKDQTMHHLRFSIEYLRRQCLLGTNGTPLNFAGLVSHLYFTENSSFAFHALLKEGYFHDLCSKVTNNEKDTLETLMLVMAHLFHRTYCRQADEEYKKTVVKPSSSIVFLPPLPKKAAEILRNHNKETLEVYQKYAETFSRQHITTPERMLPLTGYTTDDENENNTNTVQSLPSTRVRSTFVALSGHGDSFDSIRDLCQTTRDGIFLEEAVVPHVSIFPEETEQPLNAYLLDFFKHGDIITIEKANGIRKSDIWFLLNDFSLVLATIITSLEGFMKLKEGSDMDMLDLMGDVDAHEESEDEKGDIAEAQSEASVSTAVDSVMMTERPKPMTKKGKNIDSWEDQADKEEAAASKVNDQRVKEGAATNGVQSGAAWEGESGGGKGLRDVLKAFKMLHAQFHVKFRAMWA